MESWPQLAGTGGLFAIVCWLIALLMKDNSEQRARLLEPAYERIEACEDRIAHLEAENEVCQSRLGRCVYVLAMHGIEVPE